MKVLNTVILALAFILGVNSLPKAASKEELIGLVKGIPRHQLEAQLRALVAPGFKAALDDSIINLLDTTVRQIIIEGSEELGIPPLDPAKLDHVDLDLNLDGLVLKGSVDNAQAEKISTFVVDSVKTNLLLLRVEAQVSVPEIVASGEHYKLEGNVGGLLPVHGEGSFSVSVKGLVIKVKISLGSSNSFINVKTLELDVTLEEIKTDFKGLLGDDEDLSNLINEIISDLAPELFEELKPSVLPVVADAIVNLANEKLEGVTLQDLLDLINGGGLKKL
ncbi:hypothetical protein B7P43_G07836 [Cryptotermes secundus]|uniref:Uncharacterized protein n=1 Tax=Cryptotermes secundus TaxID=105785 RepID=A0A2J7QLB0_9NEOP|nr:uncharacterized protein LOC111866804 [Cryptotermes secundus]PNF29373.1 hypothetical protein B7P43_G07836 [Cryptotermes secundus]